MIDYSDIEIDLGDPDPESGLVSEMSSASVRSLPINDIAAILENDRRYANTSYYLPNDEAEEIRESIVHQLYLTALSGHLTFHRIGANDNRILDVGSGSGDWAVAMAEKYPRAEITATDIWPFQFVGVPQNLTYEISDAQINWSFTKNFDYIHMRGLVGAFQDWPAIYRQANQACSDGGHIEVVDLSLIKYATQQDGTALEVYNTALQQAASIAGTSVSLEHFEEETIREAGFWTIRRASLEIPIGTWSLDPTQTSLGKLALVAVLEGLESRCLRLLTTFLNWTVEQISNLCESVKTEILQANLQPSMICQILVAKKMSGMV